MELVLDERTAAIRMWSVPSTPVSIFTLSSLLHRVLAETISGTPLEFSFDANTLREHGWFFKSYDA